MTYILSDICICPTFVLDESVRHAVQGTVERWDGSVLDTNTTCSDFGQKCLQLHVPGMLTFSHTTSYPCHCTEYNMILGNYSGVTILGDVGTTHTEFMNAAMSLFAALYGQPRAPGTSMESAC